MLLMKHLCFEVKMNFNIIIKMLHVYTPLMKQYMKDLETSLFGDGMNTLRSLWRTSVDNGLLKSGRRGQCLFVVSSCLHV